MPERDPANDLKSWNAIAERYAQSAGNVDDTTYGQLAPVLWECLGDVEGLNVLDLGCGHGWLSGLLAEAGANVTGIDGSAELLKRATQRYPEIAFLEHDLSQGLPDTLGTFGHIVAHMVLMDIPVLEQLIRDVAAHLEPSGRFIFTLPHPSFFNQKLGRDPDTGQPFRAVAGYHKEEVWRLGRFGG